MRYKLWNLSNARFRQWLFEDKQGADRIFPSWLNFVHLIPVSVPVSSSSFSDKADVRTNHQYRREAEMCGNGIRCFAKYVYDHKIIDKKNLPLKHWPVLWRRLSLGQQSQHKLHQHGQTVHELFSNSMEAEGRSSTNLEVDGRPIVTCSWVYPYDDLCQDVDAVPFTSGSGGNP